MAMSSHGPPSPTNHPHSHSSSSDRPEHPLNRHPSIGDASQLFGGGSAGLDDFLGSSNSSHTTQAPPVGALVEGTGPSLGFGVNLSDPFAWPSLSATSSTGQLPQQQASVSGHLPSSYAPTDPCHGSSAPGASSSFFDGRHSSGYPLSPPLPGAQQPASYLSPSSSYSPSLDQPGQPQYPSHSLGMRADLVTSEPYASAGYNPYAPPNPYAARDSCGPVDSNPPRPYLPDIITRAGSVDTYSSSSAPPNGLRPMLHQRSNTTQFVSQQATTNAQLNRPKVYDAYDPPAIRKKKPHAYNSAASQPASPALGAPSDLFQSAAGSLTPFLQSPLLPPPPKQRSISGPSCVTSPTGSALNDVPGQGVGSSYSILSQPPPPPRSPASPRPLCQSPVSVPMGSAYSQHYLSSGLVPIHPSPPNHSSIGFVDAVAQVQGGHHPCSQADHPRLHPSASPETVPNANYVDDPYAPTHTSHDVRSPGEPSSGSFPPPWYSHQTPLSHIGAPVPGTGGATSPPPGNSIPAPPPPSTASLASDRLLTPSGPLNARDCKPKRSSPLKMAVPLEGEGASLLAGVVQGEAAPPPLGLAQRRASEGAIADSLDQLNLAASRLTLNSEQSTPADQQPRSSSLQPGHHTQPLHNNLRGSLGPDAQPRSRYPTCSSPASTAGLMGVPTVHVLPATPEVPVVDISTQKSANGFDVLADLQGPAAHGPDPDYHQVTSQEHGVDEYPANPGWIHNGTPNFGTVNPTEHNCFSQTIQPTSDTYSQSSNPYALCAQPEPPHASPTHGSEPQYSLYRSSHHAYQDPYAPQSLPSQSLSAEALLLGDGAPVPISQPPNFSTAALQGDVAMSSGQYAPPPVPSKSPHPVLNPPSAEISAYTPTSLSSPLNDSASASDPVSQRLKAKVPVASFGFGGKLITVFPMPSSPSHAGYEAPYQATAGFMPPCASRTSVTIHQLSHVIPCTELQNFPGPLFLDGGSKSSVGKKRKEVIHWLDGKVNDVEQELAFLHGATNNRSALGSETMAADTSDTRVAELEDKLVLVKLLKVLVEHEGKLSGTPKVEEAIRGILHQTVSHPLADSLSNVLPISHDLTENNLVTVAPTPKEVTGTSGSSAVSLDDIQRSLSYGDRVQALQTALNQKLWAHALVIANSLGSETWRETVRGFVKIELSDASANPHELKLGGDRTSDERQGLRVLYNLLAGAGPAAVEELLPAAQLPASKSPSPFGQGETSILPHPPLSTLSDGSRAPSPLPLLRIDVHQAQTKLSNSALKQWRTTVALTVANRVPGSGPFLLRLGELLLDNNRVYAAHVAFLLSNGAAPLACLENGKRITLLGDKGLVGLTENDWAGLDAESVMLTEVLEFALSLAPIMKNQEPYVGLPYVQGYRLALAFEYAGYGLVGTANRYCEAVAPTLKLSTRPSPFYHVTLLEQVKSLSARLSATPTSDKNGSWIARKMPRSALDNVWQSLEGRVHKFVAGEDDPVDQPASGQPNSVSQGIMLGPFSHYSSISVGNTPENLSRVPSVVELANSDVKAREVSGFQSSPFQRPPSGAGYSSPYESDPRQRSISAMIPPYGPSSISLENYATNAADPASESQQPLLNTSDAPTSPSGTVTAENNSGSGGWWEAASQHAGQTIAPPVFASVEDANIANDTSGFIDPMASFGIPGYNSTNPGSFNRSAQEGSSAGIPREEENEDLGFGNNASKNRRQDSKENSGYSPSQEKDSPPKSTPASSGSQPQSGDKTTIKHAPSSSWLGRLFKREGTGASGSGPIKAKLGEEVSLVYDPETKRWVNKKSGSAPAATTPPPPARAQTASPTSSMRAGPEFSTVGGGALPPPPPSMMRNKTAELPKAGGGGRSSLDNHSTDYIAGPPVEGINGTSGGSPSVNGSSMPPLSSASDGPPPATFTKKPAKKNIRSRYVEIR